VAEDYLVSFETNRYSVPFTLIGQPVEVLRRGVSVSSAPAGPSCRTHTYPAARPSECFWTRIHYSPIVRLVRLTATQGHHARLLARAATVEARR